MTEPKRGGPRRTRKRTSGPVDGHYRISRAALADFMRDRSYWMEYAVSGIQDAELRRLAEMVRAEAGGRWEKLRMFANGAAPGTFSAWRAAGWPGPGWEVVHRGTADWIWLPARTAPPATPKRRGKR